MAVDVIATKAATGDSVELTLAGFMGSRFKAYRDVVVGLGARYVPSKKINVLPITALIEARRLLAEVGITLGIDETLRAALAAEADEMERLGKEGQARLDEVDARLADRGLALFPYQRSGVRWMAPRRRALLGDEMGLGKTVQALVALPAGASALVVAPGAVQFNWWRECRRWRPDLRPTISAASKDTFRWPRPGEVLITTYGKLPLAEDERRDSAQSALFGGVQMPEPGTVLIADEAHALKGSAGRRLKDGSYQGGTLRVRRWNGLKDAVLSCDGRVWLITGTPLLNREKELWRVLDAAGAAQDAFGSWTHFAGMLGSEDLAPALQRVMLRRRREEVLPDLPRKLRQTLQVPIDEETMLLCDEVLAKLKKAGVSLDKVLETKGGGILFEEMSRVRSALATAKIPAALERAESYEGEEEPLVVFSAHVAPLDALAERDGWLKIDGGTPTEDRQRAVDRFQAGELKGLALSYPVGGVGITLTRGHHVLCVDLPWTPALLQQAEDRCCRIGQDADSVHVEILAGDHALDARVAEILLEKTEAIERSVERAAMPQDYTGAEKEAALIAEARSFDGAVVDAEAVNAARQKATAGPKPGGIVDPRELKPGNVRVGRFRAPKDPVEVWAARGIMQLADDDPDRASTDNGVGFSAFDGEFGHSLATALRQYGRLSDRQWECAVKMARKYRGQVGEPPNGAGA